MYDSAKLGSFGDFQHLPLHASCWHNSKLWAGTYFDSPTKSFSWVIFTVMAHDRKVRWQFRRSHQNSHVALNKMKEDKHEAGLSDNVSWSLCPSRCLQKYLNSAEYLREREMSNSKIYCDNESSSGRPPTYSWRMVYRCHCVRRVSGVFLILSWESGKDNP